MQQAPKAQPEPLALKDNKAPLEPLVLRVPQEHPALRAQSELRVLKAQLVPPPLPLAPLEPQGLPVRQALKVPLALPLLKVLLVLPDQQVHQDQPV